MSKIVIGLLFGVTLCLGGYILLRDYVDDQVKAAVDENDRWWQSQLKIKLEAAEVNCQTRLQQSRNGHEEQKQQRYQDGYQTGHSSGVQSTTDHYEGIIKNMKQEHTQSLGQLHHQRDSLSLALRQAEKFANRIATARMTGTAFTNHAAGSPTSTNKIIDEKRSVSGKVSRWVPVETMRFIPLVVGITAMIAFVTILATIVLRWLQQRERRRFRI